MKFEEAYWQKEDKMLRIDEITEIFHSKQSIFAKEIKDYLFCPECKKPQLAYNNASNPYLRAFPKSQHADWCSLKQGEMNSVRAEQFINDEKNKDIIIRQMQSAMLALMNPTASPSKTSSKVSSVSKGISPFPVSHSSTSKRLPRKRIDIKFCPKDFNCVKIFYGTVYAKWETDVQTFNETEKWRKILMYDDNNQLLCKLKISPKVYNYIPEHYKGMNGVNCAVAFLAKFNDDGRKYRTTSLRSSAYLIMEKTTNI